MDNEHLHIPIQDYQYELPQERIAFFPEPQRDASKLLIYRDGIITDDHFYNLPTHLHNATLVLNDTRVLEARLFFHKPTGGMIEILVLEPEKLPMEKALQQESSSRWTALIGGASKWKPGQVLSKSFEVQGNPVILELHYIGKRNESFVIEFRWNRSDMNFASILEQAGQMPLPPYIKREVSGSDKERYQTVFNREQGSVAAPTAALHFTPEILAALRSNNVLPAYLTLHVGAGTFKPVKSETIGAHEMHREVFTITIQLLEALLNSERVIAVGTTSLRALESLYWLGFKQHHGLLEEWSIAQWEPYELIRRYPPVSKTDALRAILLRMQACNVKEMQCATSILIVPGYPVAMADALITNFHQPGSTLLLLVSAFIGDDWKNIYRHAIENKYRFLSYGDSSLLWRKR